MRTHRKLRATLLARASALIAVLTAVAGCGGAVSQKLSPGGPVTGAIAFQLVTPTEGWILTDNDLLWTADAGGTSRVITPSGVAASAIRGSFFRDAQTGWVVSSDSQSEAGSILKISKTTNGGSSWALPATLTASAGASGQAALSFVDSQQGWLLVQLESSSNFNFGELYHTTDGGSTWTQLPQPPSGGEIRFVSTTRGFIAGGPIHEHLYVTQDGGASWQDQSPGPLPSNGSPAYTLPTFMGADIGVVVVTVSYGGSTTVDFYRTTNGAASWTLARTTQVAQDLEPGVIVPNAVLSADSWRLVYPDGQSVLATEDAGLNWSTSTPSGLSAGVQKVEFSSSSHGWSLIQSGTCAPDKITCTDVRDVRWTGTTGQTWAVVGS
jgi:photosystem II stability/assembly factor-like uncharacterized protein